jgi:outer membrane protein OmpA-like peptidoglycan-associated protein
MKTPAKSSTYNKFIEYSVFHVWQSALIGAMGALLLLIAATASASDTMIIYDTPPSAEELADILYPMSSRAIVFSEKGTPAENEGPREFGMLITFEYDSTEITGDSLPYLESLGKLLQMPDLDDTRLVIEGHTDDHGSDEYNQNLSERRAQAIKRHLVNNYNLEQERLVTVGRGESEPFDASNPVSEINRRVEFRALN